MLQLFPRLFYPRHGLKNRFIWWKKIIKVVLRVRWLYFLRRKHIRILLLHPQRARTRLYNMIKIRLIFHHCCKKWHVCLDRHTWSTRWRKNPRILHMRSEKGYHVRRGWSPPRLDPIIRMGIGQLKVHMREGYIPTPTFSVVGREWSIIGIEALDDAFTHRFWKVFYQ